MRRILVTGANKGIGLAIAARILEDHEDTFVLLGSRSSERGQAARAGLVETHPQWSERVELLVIDVSSDESVAAAAETAKNKHGSLYGIVNNAGIGFGKQALQETVNVNTLGTRRVCEAFKPLLGDGGRIVNITSASGPNFVAECSDERQAFFRDESVTWDALQALIDECFELAEKSESFEARGLGAGNAYGLSKALGNSYTMLLARENPNLCVNACTPGFIETDMTRHYAQSSGRSPADMGMKAPAEGTKSAMFLLFGDVDGSGRYYGSDAIRSPMHRYRSPGDPPYTGD